MNGPDMGQRQDLEHVAVHDFVDDLRGGDRLQSVVHRLRHGPIFSCSEPGR